jgi:hypothetical protein
MTSDAAHTPAPQGRGRHAGRSNTWRPRLDKVPVGVARTSISAFASAFALILVGQASYAAAQTAQPVNGEVKKQQPAGGIDAVNPPRVEKGIPLITISGDVSLRNYNNVNNFNHPQDQFVFAGGGHVIARTAEFAGFSGALGVYASQSLNIVGNDGRFFNIELTGPTGNQTSVREGYLQYRSDKFVVRGGRQLLQTPFASQDYYTFHPRAFEGLAASYNVIGGGKEDLASGAMTLDDRSSALSVMAVRMYQYANRFAPGFTSGSEVSGDRSTDGFYAFGIRGARSAGLLNLTAQAWYYDFMDYARMFHARISARANVGTNGEAILEAQGLREWSSGGGRRAILDLTGGTASSVDARLYAGKAGYRLGKVTLSAIGTYSPERRGAFRNGGVLEPYSSVPYTLYSDTLMKGMGELGPGYSYGANIAFDLLDKRFSSYFTAVRYKARYGFGLDIFSYGGPLGFSAATPIPNQQSYALESISVLKLDSVQKGLSVSYVFGLFDSENRQGYPHYENPFLINRFLIKFAF